MLYYKTEDIFTKNTCSLSNQYFYWTFQLDLVWLLKTMVITSHAMENDSSVKTLIIRHNMSEQYKLRFKL